MPKGFLIVNVFFDDLGTPVKNASVKITGVNFEKIVTTDESGKTSVIELDAPDINLSQTSQEEIRPYSTYDLEITKAGLKTGSILNLEIFAGETAIQNVFLHENFSETIDFPDHILWEPDEPKIPENPEKGDLPFIAFVLPMVVIPEFIIVHDGAPSNHNAPNHIVSFTDYIKNVACSEIYSTWPRESLKANVHAIVSFTLNRIFTEWYRGQGFNFTITSTTQLDQKYIHNRTIYKSISDVVDDYFRYYIRLTGRVQPFLAQYNDGRRTNNPNWLSQWGSRDMAAQGFTAIQILRHFYTNNLDLHVADEVVGLPSSFPGYNLSVGSCGEYVQKIQIELNRIRGNFPAIPVISPADGMFNESTRRSVETFQRVFDLPQTGIINFATWYRISRIFTAVSGLAAGL